MLNRMKIVMCASLLMSSLLVSLSATAGTTVVAGNTVVYPAHITELATGWGKDTWGIYTDVPVANPANCPNNTQYVSDATDPGNRTYLATALAAFVNKLPITVVVSNTQCTADGFAKIMAITPSQP